jgi:hypothetical protein
MVMAHVKGMFVTRGFPLPRKADRFTLKLPADGNFRVHYVVPEGEGSVLVIEYGVPHSEAADVHFEVIDDDIVHSELPENVVYLGTYAVAGVGFLHVYGPRGCAGESRRLM